MLATLRLEFEIIPNSFLLNLINLFVHLVNLLLHVANGHGVIELRWRRFDRVG